MKAGENEDGTSGGNKNSRLAGLEGSEKGVRSGSGVQGSLSATYIAGRCKDSRDRIWA